MKTYESALGLMMMCFLLADAAQYQQHKYLEIAWLIAATFWMITALYRKIKE